MTTIDIDRDQDAYLIKFPHRSHDRLELMEDNLILVDALVSSKHKRRIHSPKEYIFLKSCLGAEDNSAATRGSGSGITPHVAHCLLEYPHGFKKLLQSVATILSCPFYVFAVVLY